MKNKLRILLSGPGLIGTVHAGLIQGLDQFQLVALVAPAKPEHDDFASSFNIPRFDTIERALKEVEIDAALISSPNEFHFEQVSACMLAGKPVFVEKPLTDNLADAKRLVELSEKKNIPVLVGHHRTYSPLLDSASSFLQSESFGQFVAMFGSALFFKPSDYFEAGPWRSKKGGGPILINLIHEIGLMRFFCGEIEEVFAYSSHCLRKFEVEDTVSLNFRFVNGGLGTFLLSDVAASNKSWEMTSGENPAYPYFDNQDCYHFAGTNGSLDFPTMTARSYLDSSMASWWNDFSTVSVERESADPLRRQLEHFYDVIRYGHSPKVSVKDGYENMRVVEAIGLSIERNASVSIDEMA